ncbi:MAG: PAS domain S-box protein [Chloroflexota bacterium]
MTLPADLRFQDLFEAAPDALVLVDTGGRIRMANTRAEELFGYTRADLEGEPVEQLIPPRFAAGHVALREAFAHAPRTRPMGIGMDLTARHRDGHEIPVEISLSALTGTEGQIFIAAVRDITARRKAEAALRESERRFHGIFDQVFNFVGLLAPDGTLLEANQTALNYIQKTRSQVVGQPFWDTPWWDVSPERKTELQAAVARAAKGEIVRYETEHRRFDGAIEPFEFSIKPLRDGSGEVTLLIPEGRNIAERRRLDRAQRELTAMVNHDLMNPIAGIGLHAQVLQMSREYREESVNAIMDAARTLERLVGDLLDVSRMEMGRLRLSRHPVDMVEIARSTVAQARGHGDSSQIRLRTPRHPVVGTWDRVRIEQVLGNLLSNAVKYSPTGAPVTVTVEDLDSAARVSVKDVGPGIGPEALTHVFERFYRDHDATRTTQGMGLGLFIARALIQAHQGQISAKSRVGHGATFSFVVPKNTGGDTPGWGPA